MRLMDWLRHDLRAAVRLIVRRPGHAAIAVATLGVGLAVNAVAFSAVNALLYRSTRIARGEEIGWLTVGTRSQPFIDASLPMFDRVRRDATTLQTIAAEGRLPLAYDTGAVTDEVWALAVSPDYFSTVHVPLALGRPWRADELRPDAIVVLISERFWRSKLEAPRDLPSLALRINRQTARVVGVVRDDFEDPGGVFAPDLFIPLTARDALGVPRTFSSPSHRWLTIIARPKAGIAADAIQRDVLPLAQDEVAASGGSADDVRVTFSRIADGHPTLASVRRIAAIGLAAVGSVLLIACFNVAGLMLARSVERQREIAIRSAIGASRARLITQLIAENGVLALLAAAAALVFARWSAALLSVFSLPAPIPERLLFPTDWRLFGYTALLAAAAAVIPAAAPAWHLVRSDVASWVKGSGGTAAGRRQARARRLFIVAQTAGSTLFLAAALLFGESFANALTKRVGFDVDHTAVLQIDPGHYGYSIERSRRLLVDLRERLRHVPAVREIGIADRLPFFVGFARTRAISVDGRDCRVSRCPEADTYAVDAGFFRAMNVPIIAGRSFAPGDGPEAVVASESTAKLWSNGRAVGEIFREGPNARVRRIVGVVPDIAQRSLNEVIRPHFYQTVDSAEIDGPISVVLSTDGPPSALVGPMRDAVRALDPGLPVQSAQTMRERMALPLWLPRTIAGFFAVSGVVAVLVASVGLFGVVYYLVVQRAKEFGVRLALGATASTLRRLVVGEAVRLVTPGVVAGLAASMVLLSGARTVLFGISAASPRPYVVAAVVEWLIAIAASWLPALKAMRVDPLDVLRSE
jgi:predicted permease